MRYAIPECNIDSLEKKLTKIRNKCAKYGCEFSYERVGEHFEERSYKNDSGVICKEIVKYIDIDVDGHAALNGWRFVASLEYTDKGNIIAGVGDVEVPEKYYKCSPWCEHCKTARDRKYSFIVFHEKTGEFKQVGKACLKDFTGGLSATAVAQYESYFKEIEEASEYGGYSGFGVSYFERDAFMVCAAEAIRLYGYVRRGDMGYCTANLAEDIYRVEYGMSLGMCAKEIRERYDDAVAKGLDLKRKESVELAGTVRDWILANDSTDNYFHNLKVACDLPYASGAVLGLLVSAFPAYNRELEYAAEKKERERKEAEARAKSSWMGNVGDKVSFQIADFRVISSWETQWGYTGVFKLVDPDGREATWKTSNWLTDECIGKVIRGTIKELKEFRGVKQTELTRCKVA